MTRQKILMKVTSGVFAGLVGATAITRNWFFAVAAGAFMVGVFTGMVIVKWETR